MQPSRVFMGGGGGGGGCQAQKMCTHEHHAREARGYYLETDADPINCHGN